MKNIDRLTFTGILATILTLALITFIVLLFFKPENESSELLYIAFGVLAAGANSAWSFYFGSSQGSKDKDVTIASAVEPKRPDVL